jgi:hypothetical protein
MNTRRTLAFLLALMPTSRLLAQESAAPPADGAQSRPPVLYPRPIPDYVEYANCDASRVFPTINILDVVCFMDHVAAGSDYANCDGSTAKPYITANDLICFLNAYSLATQWEFHQASLDPVK